jgi:SPX domain protein involved in polyphosphate accumulation
MPNFEGPEEDRLKDCETVKNSAAVICSLQAQVEQLTFQLEEEIEATSVYEATNDRNIHKLAVELDKMERLHRTKINDLSKRVDELENLIDGRLVKLESKPKQDKEVKDVQLEDDSFNWHDRPIS